MNTRRVTKRVSILTITMIVFCYFYRRTFILLIGFANKLGFHLTLTICKPFKPKLILGSLKFFFYNKLMLTYFNYILNVVLIAKEEGILNCKLHYIFEVFSFDDWKLMGLFITLNWVIQTSRVQKNLPMISIYIIHSFFYNFV